MYSGPRPRAEAEQQGKDLAVALKCDDAAHTRTPAEVADCLMNLDTSAFASVPGYFGAFSLGPVVGGPVLPEAPAQAITSGHFAKVSILTGTNHDEERFMVNGLLLQGVPLATEADYRKQLAADFCPPDTASCDKVDEVAAEYRAEDYGGSYPLALSAALTDSVFSRWALDTDRVLARQVPTYAYEFADEHAPTPAGVPSFLPQGAYHTAELGYLFDVGWTTPRTPAQDQLSDQMIAYWSRFARAGNPNGPGTPYWSRFHGQAVESLAPCNSGIKQLFNVEHRYAFWKSVDQ
jgi:para-nitrobenzyl esterase